MPDTLMDAALPSEPPGIPGKIYLLAILTIPILSGALPVIGKQLGSGLRIYWLVYCLALFIGARSLPMLRLLHPMLPYLSWLACFLALGIVVSPTPVMPMAITIIFYTIISAITMAIFTYRSSYLRIFANSTQWVLLLNIIFLVLVIRYPNLQTIVTPDTTVADAYEVAHERFTGLWGNPNMAGYVCIIAIILSVWATRWLAWTGRLSGIFIIYLTASRKAAILIAIIFFMNIIIVQRKNLKSWALLGMGLLILITPVLFENRTMMNTISKLSTDRKISRMVDISEKRTGGDESRVDLFKQWLPVVSAAPWYGYGLGSMAGYDPHSQAPRKELYSIGTHNTYIGIWVDVGFFGFAGFMVIFLFYVFKYCRSKFSPSIQWALLALMTTNVLILTVSHSHLFCAEGIMAFSLFFLLPTCPALAGEQI
jgi:O-antigen ligase